MKGFLKPKLIFPVVTVVLLTGIIAISLSDTIKHSRRQAAVEEVRQMGRTRLRQWRGATGIRNGKEKPLHGNENPQ